MLTWFIAATQVGQPTSGPIFMFCSMARVCSSTYRSGNQATRDRVIAWLRQRPEVVKTGFDKEAVWASPEGERRFSGLRLFYR